jgi:hypothetical protein
MESLYLYLARRDKKGIRVLAILNGKHGSATRVTNLKLLQLPNDLERDLEEDIQANRMLWEPWIEPASSYNDLKKRLASRGYTEFPTHHKATFSRHGSPKANTTSLPKKFIMIQKSRNSS